MQLIWPHSLTVTHIALRLFPKEIMGCTYQDCEHTHNHMTSYNIMLAKFILVLAYVSASCTCVNP